MGYDPHCIGLFFHFCRMEEDFDYADYVSEERVVPEEKLGKYNMPFILFPVVFLLLYLINFGTVSFLDAVDEYFNLVNIFLIFSFGFFVHELIHFLTWQAVSGFPLSEFRVGIRWNSITPVIGCQRPMRVWQLMMGLIAPFLLMGLLPMGAAFYLNNTWLLFSSAIFMAWASADLLTFLLLWKVNKLAYAEMHRTRLGCVVFNLKPTLKESVEA